MANLHHTHPELEEREPLNGSHELSTLPVDPEPEANQTVTINPASVRHVYRTKLTDGKVTTEQVDAVVWLAEVAVDDRLTMGALAELSGIDAGTISKLFSGSYPAQLHSISRRILAYRALHEQRQKVGDAFFVPTSLSSRINTVCDSARVYSMIIPIWGDSQTGKTMALKEYARTHNHGQTVYVRMPTNGNFTEFLRRIARALGITSRGSNAVLTDSVIHAFHANKLLIIDEVHQCFLSGSRDRQTVRLKTLEYLRELWDESGCGMVLCGTNLFRDEVTEGKCAEWLQQLLGRTLTVLQLPAMLPRHDLDAIAAAYKLPPADESQHKLRCDIVARRGLKAYITYIRAGIYAANNRKETFG